MTTRTEKDRMREALEARKEIPKKKDHLDAVTISENVNDSQSAPTARQALDAWKLMQRIGLTSQLAYDMQPAELEMMQDCIKVLYKHWDFLHSLAEDEEKYPADMIDEMLTVCVTMKKELNSK